MSDNIPFEVQEEIIKRVLPVKSLIRFRSVSKRWKSLIDSSEFITGHSVNQNHQHHILVRYTVDYECKYVEHKNVSIVDDDSFPKYPLFVSPTINLDYARVLDSSHGLVCLFDSDGSLNNEKKLIVVWNPSIRKSVGILLYAEPDALGFGICPKTFDPKIIKITRWSKIGYEAQVFTIRSGSWRSIAMNLPRKPDLFSSANDAVVIDGVIHWLAFDWITNNDQQPYYRYRIISFDLTSEQFGSVDLPECLRGRGVLLGICKLKESIVVLDHHDAVCDVWMMVKNGSSFTKLFTVAKVEPYSILGFRKNGQLIVDHEIRIGYGQLQLYEPDSEHTNDLGIYGSDFSMASYTESLLLLNHPDSIIHG